MRKHTIILGALLLTIIYAGVLAWLHWGYGVDATIATYVEKSNLNSLGDFLAGIFSPLAFLWLIATVLIQSNELALQRKEITDNREVMREQADAAKSQADFISLQAQAMREQIDLQRNVAATSHKVAMFETRFALYTILKTFVGRHDFHNSTEILDLGANIQQIDFVYGKEFKRHTHELLTAMNDYYNAVAEFESFQGPNAYSGYLNMLHEWIEREGKKAVDENLQDDPTHIAYRHVMKTHTAVRTHESFFPLFMMMESLLEIKAIVGAIRQPDQNDIDVFYN